MPRPPLVLAALLAMSQATHAEMRVIGDDDRSLADSRAVPWTSIGRLNRAGRAFCTGVLIAPDRVLTAAHCLYDVAQGRWAPASAIHFLAGYSQGDYADVAVATGYAVAEGYDRAHAQEMATMWRDWAVVTLDHTLTTPPTPIWPLAFEDAAALALDGGVLLQAGYSEDRPHVLTVHEDCGLVGVAGEVPLLLHECDAIEGDSGSPLLLRQDGRYGIIGLHIARTDSEGFELGVAVPSAAFAGPIGALLGDGVIGAPAARP
ncbi:MAG: trypsin-like serine protease [Alphaproteobacteria bacterium]